MPAFEAIDMAMAPKRQQISNYLVFKAANSGVSYGLPGLKISNFHIGPVPLGIFTLPAGAKTCRWCINRTAGAPDVGAAIAERPMS